MIWPWPSETKNVRLLSCCVLWKTVECSFNHSTNTNHQKMLHKIEFPCNYAAHYISLVWCQSDAGWFQKRVLHPTAERTTSHTAHEWFVAKTNYNIPYYHMRCKESDTERWQATWQKCKIWYNLCSSKESNEGTISIVLFLSFDLRLYELSVEELRVSREMCRLRRGKYFIS